MIQNPSTGDLKKLEKSFEPQSRLKIKPIIINRNAKFEIEINPPKICRLLNGQGLKHYRKKEGQTTSFRFRKTDNWKNPELEKMTFRSLSKALKSSKKTRNFEFYYFM